MDPASHASVAARLYAEYLVRLENGEALDFDTFCAEHSDQVSELRSLRGALQRLQERSQVDIQRTGRSQRSGASGDSSSAVVDRLTGMKKPTGRYQIKEEIARGGMGVILRVWDEELRRHLAMKVMLDEAHAIEAQKSQETPKVLGRFLEEAQVTGQLSHPGIVPVHELGVDSDGRVYFTMKLVKGRNLKEVYDLVSANKEGWTRTRAIGVLLKVCEAMAYAHNKGVIHRDLKPQNVMVGRFGEVYVMDWGLAKVLGHDDGRDVRIRQPLLPTSSVHSERQEHAASEPDSPLLTMDGDVVGTPAYMSPEQAKGRIAEMGPQSDVFALGSMLYHLLAGHMPYVPPGTQATNYAVWLRLQEGPPKPLHERAPDAPAEIVAICEKAMAREVHDRYRDMAELAEDLHAFIDGRVVRAHEAGALAELRKWVLRNRALAGASIAAIALLVIGLFVSLYLGGLAERQRENVMHLSALQELEGLTAHADDLWPPTSARIPDYTKWLADADRLIAGLHTLDGQPGHYEQLQSLRDQGRAATLEELDAALRAHANYLEVARLRAQLGALRYADDVRHGRASARTGTVTPQMDGLSSADLNRVAWHFVSPQREDFGRESEGLAVAKLAHERLQDGDDRSLITDTLAWAYFANGADEQALQSAREALTAASPSERSKYEEGLASLVSAVEEANSERASARIERLDEHLERLTLAHAWRFDDDRTAWWHTQLATLVSGIEMFADTEHGLVRGLSSEHGLGIERRLRSARRAQELSLSSPDAERLWAEAAAAIARHPRFNGLQLEPQEGLVPLGPAPDSGLWEFAHVLSGEIPQRAAGDALEFDADSAIVLVLLPGGAFRMGAQNTDPAAENYEREVGDEEGPTQQVTLEPFFLSKYEMTQAQWLRFTGTNPSDHAVGRSFGGRVIEPTSPVENVSWDEVSETLRRLDLELPTEAQWEYAARAGTDTPWSSGAASDSLLGAANLADKSALRAGADWLAPDEWPDFDDGHASHAPVGSYSPNPFGLHDVHGNVEEWCLDSHASYQFPTYERNGERLAPHARQRVSRGGSMMEGPANARCAYRNRRLPDYRFVSQGVRPARALRR